MAGLEEEDGARMMTMIIGGEVVPSLARAAEVEEEVGAEAEEDGVAEQSQERVVAAVDGMVGRDGVRSAMVMIITHPFLPFSLQCMMTMTIGCDRKLR